MASGGSKKPGGWRDGRNRPAARPTSTGRARARKWSGAVVLTLLLIGSVAASAAILWRLVVPREPRPTVVAFWVGESQRRARGDRAGPQTSRLNSPVPPVPWIEADRKALRDAGVFRTADFDDAQLLNPPREVIETRLNALRALRPGDDVVVCLSAYATVDPGGKVQVLAYDSDPYEPTTLLPLRDVLKALKACPSRHKLLVLDVMRTTADPADLGGTAQGVADLVRGELRGGAGSGPPDDPDLLVLGACSAGETSQGSELLGRSIFADAFRAGLSRPEADANGDHAVSVKELAAFLEREVDRWARHYRGVGQRPFLDGTGGDFDLATVPSKPTAPRLAQYPKPEAPAPATTKEKEKVTEKQAGGAAAYPAWLAGGWAVRDRWWAGDAFLAAPRVFRRLDWLLLRAEHLWRGGDDPESVRAQLAGELPALERAMARAQAIRRPPARSVGQARAFREPADAGLAAALRSLLVTPVAQVDAKKRAEFVEKAKAVSGLTLAGAVVTNTDNVGFDAKSLEFLDALVTDSLLTRDVVELRLLKELAGRARAENQASFDQVARLAWDVVGEAEEAGSRPDEFPRTRGALEHADELRHDAEVMLLSQAAGYVEAAQAGEAWGRAARAFRSLRDDQERLRGARRERGRALVVLGAAVAYLETSGDAEYEQAWLEAAGGARALGDLLRTPPDAGTDEAAAAFRRRLDDLVPALRRACTRLERPFQPAEVDALVKACEAPTVRPVPAHFAKIEALLASPLVPGASRAELWRAGRTLERRLAEVPVADADPSPADAGGQGVGARGEPLARRERRAVALLSLVGEDDAELAPPESADPAEAWRRTSRVAGRVHRRLVALAGQTDPGRGDDLAGWVAPAPLLDWQTNPTLERRAADAEANWRWLAGRYLHESRDVYDQTLGDSPRFYQASAAECAAAGPGGEIYLEVSAPSSAAVALSRARPEREVAVRLVAHAPGGGARKVALSLLQPDDRRLTVSWGAGEAVDLRPNEPATVPLRVRWDDDGPARPGGGVPSGFIVRARDADGRSYHLLVPTKIVSAGLQPRLVLRSDPTQVDELPFDRLRLRPLPGVQKYYLFVVNPAATPRELRVELQAGAGAGSAPLSVPLKVGGNSTTAVPALDKPPGPKSGEPLARLDGPLVVRLRDDKDGGAVIEERPFHAAIASAEDYLSDYFEVTQAFFSPANEVGRKNRLTVRLKALRTLTPPPVAVDLKFPGDRALFPSLLEQPKTGTLSGALAFGTPLTLEAEDILLDPAADETGWFFLDVDGIERALWFRTEFVRTGNDRVAARDTTPRVAFTTGLRPDPASPALDVRFAVDNAPADATMVFRIGHLEDGALVDDATRWRGPAEDRALGFDARGENGALLFEARVKDWSLTFNARGLRGEKTLEARLFDASGKKELARHSTALTLDDQPPEAVALSAPERVVKGTPLAVRGEVKPPASGIKEVVFYLGTKADFEKAKEAGQTLRGEPTDASRRTWRATVPLPREFLGAARVSARFTSGVGLSEFLTSEVEVVAPPPPPEDRAAAEKAKADRPPANGAVAGKVVVGRQPQPSLTVYLYTGDPDAKDRNKPLRSATTAADGAYRFNDLKPGPYRVSCVKQTGTVNRGETKEVTVEPGKTADAPLDLKFY